MVGVQRRVVMEQTRFGKVRHIWNAKNLHLRLRLRLYIVYRPLPPTPATASTQSNNNFFLVCSAVQCTTVETMSQVGIYSLIRYLENQQVYLGS